MLDEMHAREAIAAALELQAIGMAPSWISRELQIPRRTLGRWLNGHLPRVEAPRPLAPGPYSYLLGLYLGDGHIATGAHGERYLTLSCDAAYPEIIATARAAVAAVVPGRHVWLARHPVDRCVRVICCSRWWPIVFPQHGPGRKHTRRIVLVEWQRAITTAHTRELVRGLMHSDGSRFIANQRVAAKTYSYPRYGFSNRSADIVAILRDHLDLLGIRWTSPNPGYVAIDRRSEVAKLDAFVGPKR